MSDFGIHKEILNLAKPTAELCEAEHELEAGSNIYYINKLYRVKFIILFILFKFITMYCLQCFRARANLLYAQKNNFEKEKTNGSKTNPGSLGRRNRQRAKNPQPPKVLRRDHKLLKFG